MEIVSWNCNGNFRAKWQALFGAFPSADVYIVEECEDPTFFDDAAYRQLFATGFYAGTPDFYTKGIGVFAPKGHRLRRLRCDYGTRLMLAGYAPFMVDDGQKILAVWPHGKYVEEMLDFLALNEALVTDELVIIGDTNSNAVFNRSHPKAKNHDAMVVWLREKGLVDAYNHVTGEAQGEETLATFYQWRHEDKPFHLDRAYVSPQRLRSFAVVPRSEHGRWLELSDHMPIVLDIADK